MKTTIPSRNPAAMIAGIPRIRMLVLPPKRWESSDHPRFDPIRVRSWFHRQNTRKYHIPTLAAAYTSMLTAGWSQSHSCSFYGVSDRELRDYTNWREKRPVNRPEFAQMGLDEAYLIYNEHQGRRAWRDCIRNGAQAWGINGRHLMEAWEVDATFYPSYYLSWASSFGWRLV